MGQMIFCGLTACLLLAAPGVAWAEKLACNFSKECMDAEACEDTNFQISAEFAGENSKIVSDAETVTGRQFGSEDGKVKGLIAIKPSGNAHLLTVSESQTARYTTQMPASDIALYYLGACKGAE